MFHRFEPPGERDAEEVADARIADWKRYWTQIHHALALDLSRLGLRRIPDAVRRLHGLSYLDITGNRIKDLPEWIGELKNLELLKAGQNVLESVNPAVGTLSKL